MRIGLDFDNTLVCYDEVFQFVARELGFISDSWTGGKAEIRSEIQGRPNGEIDWQRLQGQAYGKWMHRATLFPEVANFLLRSRIRGDDVFIVSHKTKYGHHDLEQIPLRTEALRWMDAHRFFGPEGFGLSEGEVFFEETRNAKARRIAKLDCDVFIDDLREVFAEPDFPDQTKKILFGMEPESDNTNAFGLITRSWRDIAKYVLDLESEDEIRAQIEFAVGDPVDSCCAVEGRANSRIFKVQQSARSLAAKFYPDLAYDSRDRLGTEKRACEFLRTENCDSVLRVVSAAPELNVGIYEWIEGAKVLDIRDNDIDQALEFVETLHRTCSSVSAVKLPFASEACLSEDDIWSQIDRKRLSLNKVLDNSSELRTFLLKQFDPFVAELREIARSLFPRRDRFARLPANYQTLSASDFGFHNAIRTPNNSLKWIDLEYFGWDDPVKMIAEFIWHPGFQLSESQSARWKNGCMNIFSKDSDLIERFELHFPLYGVRWCLIVLNTFLQSERGQHSTSQARLEKAKSYLSLVQGIVSRATGRAQEK